MRACSASARFAFRQKSVVLVGRPTGISPDTDCVEVKSPVSRCVKDEACSPCAPRFGCCCWRCTPPCTIPVQSAAPERVAARNPAAANPGTRDGVSAVGGSVFVGPSAGKDSLLPGREGQVGSCERGTWAPRGGIPKDLKKQAGEVTASSEQQEGGEGVQLDSRSRVQR